MRRPALFLALSLLSQLALGSGETGFPNGIKASTGRFGLTGTVDASSVFDASSTTKGMLPPRMTTTQRDAISSPAEGLFVENLTTHTLDWYNGSAWRQVASLTGITTTAVSNNATYYPIIVPSSSNSVQALDLSTGLTFNPSTLTLTAGTFAGNATTATTAAADTETSNATIATASALTTASSLASIGTVTTGTWNGTKIGSAYGGTNIDTSASTGYPSISSGTWSVASAASTFSTLYKTIATTLGDLVYGGASGAPTRLAGDTSNTRKFLRELSSGGTAAAPAWDTLASGDIPNNAANTTGTATNATNATNTGITDDTSTNATMYPTWVTTTTGNLPQKVSSTKLTFNPSTGSLTTTTVVAAVTGTASGNTTISGQTNHGVVVSGSSNAMGSTAAGTSGQPLLSAGASADPAYGTLGISFGGTGATTKAAAFDALQPMSASGDIIYGGTSGTGTRLAKGSNGQILTLASGLPSWANAAAGSYTAPTIQKFTSGSGTYTTAANVLYIRVVMVGGGGGGAGSGTSGAGSGTAGNASTFGTTLLSAGGGSRALGGQNDGGPGGTSSLGTGPVGTALTGGSGSGNALYTISNQGPGAPGGASAFGGAGAGAGDGSDAGTAGAANTGGGGGGGGCAGAASCITGSGGGSGGYVDAIITSPSATYAYTVGASVSGGSGGTSGFAGGGGASGYIIVTEYYQ